MKKVTAIALVAMMAGMAMAEDGVTVSMSADLASAYVFRGTTFNDGLVLQPGLEVGGLPVTVGVWANFDIDDYDGALTDSQFSEIDIYASYDLGAGFGIGYCEYTYPGADGEADREVSLSYEADLPGAPSISANYGIDGGIDKSLYIELGVSQDVEVSEDLSISLGAAVGYADPDEGKSGFSHYTVSASTSIGIFGIGLNYIGQIDDEVLADVSYDEEGAMSAGYDTDFYVTLGIAQDF